MKKFLLKIALFFTLMALIDVACGMAFNSLRGKLKGGRSYKSEYVLKHCKDEILILGSSRADHHYVPSVLEDSLGLTCYNAGEMGCGIIPAYIRYELVSQRQKPKLVLYEVTPLYDYLQDDGYSHYLGVIRPYSNNPLVKPMYLDFSDDMEQIRLLSSMYRNNSSIINLLKDLLRPAPDYKGYEPLKGKINPESIGKRKLVAPSVSVDSLKLKWVEKLIEKTREDEVPLVFVVSPSLRAAVDRPSYVPLVELCEKYNVPLIDNMEREEFVSEYALFQDLSHFNHEGAVAYSKFVVSEIKPYLQSYGE